MSIYDVVEKQRAALLAREYQAVKGIVRAYEVAERRVETSIRQFQAKIKAAQAAGLKPSLAWYYQEARLENVLREIRMHLDDFSKDALEFSSKGRADAYELGAVHALRLAEAQVYGDIAGLHAGAFANAQALLSADSPLKALFDEIGPTATVKAREIFAQGIAEGWNPRKMGRILAGEVEDLTKRRAVLIARTEQIRAYRMANRDVYKRNSDVLRGWRWMAAKTPATCAMCLALDGEIFPVEETLSSHPACRCSMLPLPNTDFGGPQPASGADYFDKLSEAEQDRTLGKGKGKMYREGKITLKDNVRFRDHADWGRQPTPRPLADLRTLHAKNYLPSQRGFTKLSPFEALPARKLSDLLIEAEKKASDPVEKALDAWGKVPAYSSGDKKPTFKTTKDAPYKKLVKGKLDDLESTLEEVDLSSLVSTVRWIGDDKVRAAIKNLGDGYDLPVVFRQGSTLYIHNGEGLARLQAKAMLGQTKTTVRIFDADLLAVSKTPVEEAIEAIKDLGVKTVKVINGDEAEVLRALAWAKDRIEGTGVVPKEVLVAKGAGGAITPSGEFVVGTDLSDIVVDDLMQSINNSSLVDKAIQQGNSGFLDKKAAAVRVSLDRIENVEAGLRRTGFDYDTSAATSKLLTEWGETRYNLISLRAFENGQIEDALEEAIILYRRGEYRRGSLPESIEKSFLKQADTLLGKRKVLDAYSDEEIYLFQQTAGQGGSNPGGMYLGMDGVKRYVKFYANEERGMVENIANAIYAKHGIAVPKSITFKRGGKTVFATEVVEGKTIQALGGINSVDKAVLEDAFGGYMLDAFLANWDVVGLSADNMIVSGGKVIRIDNGGTFIFRAQGTDKPDSALQAFEEFFSLGGKSSKGYDGQFKPILARLGYNSVEEAVKPLTAQAKALATTLDKIAKTEADWLKFFDATSPGLSDVSKKRMAAMMLKRRALISDKILEIEAKSKGAAAQAILAAKQAAANAKAAAAAAKNIGKDKATREALLQKGKKPLTQAAYEKILKSKQATWAIQNSNTTEFSNWITRVTDIDESLERLRQAGPKGAKALSARVTYAGSSYNTTFNNPLRQIRKHGTPIDSYSRELINSLKDAIAENKKGITEDVLVSRWLRGSTTEAQWHKFTDLDVGTVISDSAFKSTSVRPSINPTGGDLQLFITYRKGERRFTTAHFGELELLFDTDILLIVKKVEQLGNGRVRLHVEAIPEGYTVPKGTVIKYALTRLFSKKKEVVDPARTVVRDEPREADPVTTLRHSLCANCSRKFAGAPTCDAYPEGIPVGILVGELDHRFEIPGDLGLVYEPRTLDEEIDLL
ncbi:MAG: phage minor head protein [Pyrinomonadaceae bacterium]